MPLWIAYAPHALSAVAVLAYALRRIPMIIMWGVLAFAFSWCVGRDVSLNHPVMITIDSIFAGGCAMAALLCVIYDDDGDRR